MALKAIVKLSGINNLSDARYAAGMGVQLCGLPVPEWPLHEPLRLLYTAITGWVAGVEWVAEWHDAFEFECVISAKEEIGYTWLQANIADALLAAECTEKAGLKLLLRSGEEEALEAIKANEAWFSSVSAILLVANGAKVPNAEKLKATGFKGWILAENGSETKVSPEKLEEIITENKLDGFAFEAGEEERPGLKSFDDLAPLLEALETEDY
ncbi:MAG: hypothetical protein V4543_15045 [Bacteroidota bacterium]